MISQSTIIYCLLDTYRYYSDNFFSSSYSVSRCTEKFYTPNNLIYQCFKPHGHRTLHTTKCYDYQDPNDDAPYSFPKYFFW